ncbi:MAG: hypothetical protein IJ879_04875, partial [Muribaculaceae bacterium]|nr:hypothetical protein [Muribaculaceae bacterium]
ASSWTTTRAQNSQVLDTASKTETTTGLGHDCPGPACFIKIGKNNKLLLQVVVFKKISLYLWVIP